MSERDPALALLEELDEETMRRAWGEERGSEDRRRIASAALIFGEQLEERLEEGAPGSDEQARQRFLMGLMNAAIREFARRENLSQDEAADFLGDLGTRDRVLELNEALDARSESGRLLDELLGEAVESRQEKAIWSDHWSSG